MRYSTGEGTSDGYRAIRLNDTETGVTAEILPGVGNNTVSLAKNGRNFLWRPERPLDDLVAHRILFGIPLLAPWANRLNSPSYWVNGSRFHLNMELGNIRSDHNFLPIHGLLLFEPWNVQSVSATEGGAEVVSVLPFARHPKLMAQFPFAHSLRMTHTLREGRLHVRLAILNECESPIPVSCGFHPYFTIPDTRRNEWQLNLPVSRHFFLDSVNLPTGETSQVSSALLDVQAIELDDVYSPLERNPDGYVRFDLSSASARLSVAFGPKYPVAVVYAPRTGNFVCLEPMSAITNALNLAHDRLYDGLQWIQPGGLWEEEFWIEPSAA